MKKLISAITAALLLASCASMQSFPSDASLAERVSYLESQNARLSKKLDAIARDIASIQTAIGQRPIEKTASQPTTAKTETTWQKQTATKNTGTRRASSSSVNRPAQRCQATTAQGTQCKRNAAPGSKYCWQHSR